TVARVKPMYGWKPRKDQLTPTGLAQMDETVLQSMDYPEAKVVLAWKRASKKHGYIASEKKSNGQGGGWLVHMDTRTHRVHANLNWNGCITHRPSCSSPNLQQVDTGSDMRGVWIPQPGWKMIGVDSEGIELRCLGHYLAKYDGGTYAEMVINGDIHTFTMELLGLNVLADPVALKKINRNNTKRVEYAFLYGAGDYKLGLICQENAWDSKLPINFAALGLAPVKSLAKVGAAIRAKLLIGIDGLDELVKAVQLRAELGQMRGLDGRILFIRSKHSALNTLLQSAGILTVKGTISIYPGMLEDAGLVRGRDWNCNLWVHDELVMEGRPEVAEQVGAIVAQAFVDGSKLVGFRVPTAGKVQIGDSWAEVH
ncbi:MAG: hypothetical protein IID36_05615, partial [Planctomycetes bacterium]|nr:hypothetical protein [Planctomycetota bacterium]